MTDQEREKVETLRTYASIMEKPRRYERNGPLYPAPEIAVAAARHSGFRLSLSKRNASRNAA